MTFAPGSVSGRRCSHSPNQQEEDYREFTVILMSGVEGVDPNRPVTTTYDASNGAQLAAELHTFITERALERVAAAGAANDWAAVNKHLRGLHVVDAVYAATKRSPDQEAAAVEHLRIMSLRDRHHTEYRPVWSRSTPRSHSRARSHGSSG